MHASFKSLALAMSLFGVVSVCEATPGGQALGVLSGAGTAFSSFFTSAQTFSDYYTFTLDSGHTGITGRTTDTSYVPLVSRDIQIDGIAIVDGLTHTQVGNAVTTAGQFSFNGLMAGHEYGLLFTGSALAGAKLTEGRTAGNYAATVQAVASSAPEASELAMSVMGLMGVGLLCHRSKRAA